MAWGLIAAAACCILPIIESWEVMAKFFKGGFKAQASTVSETPDVSVKKGAHQELPEVPSATAVRA